ncbi:MAG: hypothetical protein ACK559_35135, partial [bacterium]
AAVVEARGLALLRAGDVAADEVGRAVHVVLLRVRAVGVEHVVDVHPSVLVGRVVVAGVVARDGDLRDGAGVAQLGVVVGLGEELDGAEGGAPEIASLVHRATLDLAGAILHVRGVLQHVDRRREALRGPERRHAAELAVAD